MNKCILQGRITDNLEIKNTQNGKQVLSFNLAVRRDKDNADFIPCVAWEKTAGMIGQYFHKGDGIIVEGRLQSRKWQDKNGNNRTAYDVIVTTVDFPLGRKGDTADVKPAQTAQTAYDDYDESLPF